MSKHKSQRKLENILNRMKIKTHQKILNAAKAILRRRFIGISVQTTKEGVKSTI